ncbi:MAG: hypothetical protein KAT70_08755 [Thermoplasmata archaeon]|nr:hypothetical protein [Thermoplasmata archaeon]
MMHIKKEKDTESLGQIAWCGEKINAYEVCWIDIDCAIVGTTGEPKDAPCPECLKAVIGVLQTGITEEKNDTA